MWQAMSKSASLHLETVYDQLCKEKSPHERIIQRDLARTFPRIDMFKQENGKGQSSMKHILEAYSLYDTEVGYCQGLAFLVGPLLMNMPETQSFCVFVRLMETYEMRSMFTLNMEGLQLRLYQFSSLLSEIIPDVSEHLSNFGVHAAMYASQWFLTLFAYVFPMKLVTRIYDIIFAEGAAETIMRVAIAMLKRSQSSLLAFHEFEDILDFVTTKKLCDPYSDNYSNVIRDAMALSDIITRDKMDALATEYGSSAEDHKQLAVSTGRFGFWKRKALKKPDMKRSVSSHESHPSLPPVLKKRWSSVSSRHDWSYNHSNEEAMQDLKLLHQKTLKELLELKYDKQDLEAERDALKLTIVELERRRTSTVDLSKKIPFKAPPKPIFLCDEPTALDGTRSFSDLAVATKEEDNITISRQNSIHHSMLSNSSYTTTEFDDDDDDQLSLSLTTTTAPLYTDQEELSSQIVHLKVKNFELEQQVEKLNQDVDQITSKFDMVNEGQMALVDKLMLMKTEMDEHITEVKNKNKLVQSVNDENQRLKQQIEMLKQTLSHCRVENGILNQDLELIKKKKEDELIQLDKSDHVRIRRHSTNSSGMLTLVNNRRIQQLEQSLTATKIKLVEYESLQQVKKKPSIYGRVLHAMKYNS
ncbi:rab-GTPase-TBC domain-containing protein [Thamnidium elegans]|nr:rab-GTPase-TBC domain-containing protein [Thamnidium elegans]